MSYNCHNFCDGQVLDAQTMNEIEQGILDLEDKATITGKGAPSNKTVGVVGRQYMDTDTGALYKCTAAADGVYTWMPVEAGGGNVTPEQIGAAPYNAVIEQSPQEEWIDRSWGEMFYGWKWERRMDGTFTLVGFTSIRIDPSDESGTGYPVGETGTDNLPVEVYDCEYTYTIYDSEERGIFDAGEVNFELRFAVDYPGDWHPLAICGEVYYDDAIHQASRESGIEDLIFADVEVVITGKWGWKE